MKEIVGYIAFIVAVLTVLYMFLYIGKTVDEDTKRITEGKS